MKRSLSCCIAELSLPPGVVLDCVTLDAICFAVSNEDDIPSTYKFRHAQSIVWCPQAAFTGMHKTVWVLHITAAISAVCE